MSSLAERFMTLFAGHMGAHGTHGEPYQEPGKLKWEIKKTARTLREAVTLVLWNDHLEGKRPLGVITIREDNTCLHGSIDIDKYGVDLLEIIKKIVKAKLPLVPCRSKSGGLHLFLFLSEPQPAGDVQALLRDIAGTLGLAGCEIFPKQTQVLTERGDLGSWMVMPYFGSTFGERLKEQVGLKETGAQMTATEFLRIAEGARLDDTAFRALGTKRTKARRDEGDFADGPPCLQNLSKTGFPEGGRNNALFHMGVYFRKSTTEWKEALEQANHKYMKPPLSTDEVAAAIKSLEKKDYEYTCKIEPMCSHCDSLLCRTRKHGVGESNGIPVITTMSKLNTRPAIWFVDIEGIEHRLEVSTEQLQTWNLMQRVCMEEGDRVFTMKQALWIPILQEAMNNCVHIETAPDVSTSGRFYEHLEEFLTNRMRGQNKEELLLGRPWEDEAESRHYFRLRDLQRFLNRENVRDEKGQQMQRGKITRLLDALGGGYGFFNIKNKGVRVWWVPTAAVEKAVQVEPQPVPGVPI